MTDIRPSPEMLDAMAANRREAPLEERDPPAQTMIQWQAAFNSEPPIHVTGRHPALIVDGEHQAMIEATKVGVDFTAAMIEWVDAGFPIRPNDDHAPLGAHGKNPVHDALLLFERHCRRSHSRWPDHRGSPVCADIAYAVIRDRTSLQWAADQTETSYPRAERLLRAAIAFMRRQQSRWIDNEEVILPPRPPSEWMAAEHVHQPLDGAHREECPQCRAA